jgi:hypothetical protein
MPSEACGTASYAPNGVMPSLVSQECQLLVIEEPDALIGHVRVCGGSGG